MQNKEIAQALVEKQAEEEHLRNVVTHDALTGLFNRQTLLNEVAALIREQKSFTLCFLDLDGLKEVNDQYGHEQGDRYLLTVAEELKTLCRRNSDQIFRFGGDEFIILFQDISPVSAGERASSLNKNLARRKSDAAFSYPMSVSYGIVESGEFADAASLLVEADARMYSQKREKQRSRAENTAPQK